MQNSTAKKSQRRAFLKFGTASVILAAPLARAAELCFGATPPQTEGPFYPIKDQADKDWDLVQVTGRTQMAKGEVIFVEGQVLDVACKPVPSALVEIWQACATGKYNHPNDPNPVPLDPDFQYWGQCVTDADGKYLFRTIRPGAYPADETWWRPAHIHYKVHKRGFNELTTQLYFEGDRYNSADKILQQIPKAEQNRVVRPVQNGRVNFDLTLVKI